jgi:hypothetical protein
MKLLYSLPFLGLGLSSVTLASSGFFYINHKHPLNPLSERQTQICGEGDTCADACGADYVQCGTSSLNCYNPTAGDVSALCLISIPTTSANVNLTDVLWSFRVLLPLWRILRRF